MVLSPHKYCDQVRSRTQDVWTGPPALLYGPATNSDTLCCCWWWCASLTHMPYLPTADVIGNNMLWGRVSVTIHIKPETSKNRNHPRSTYGWCVCFIAFLWFVSASRAIFNAYENKSNNFDKWHQQNNTLRDLIYICMWTKLCFKNLNTYFTENETLYVFVLLNTGTMLNSVIVSYNIFLFSIATVKFCVVIFFWSSGIMECTCMLFTFENGVPLMR